MTIAIISHPDCVLHQMDDHHPESPERVRSIDKALRTAEFSDKLKFYEAKAVTKAELERVHTPDYIEYIFNNAPEEGFFHLDPDTLMNPKTLSAAIHASGAAVMAVDLVMKKEVNQVFCNVRPPGHHAERDRAMGFCFFNNVAVGVQYALDHYHLKKIAIIDFDVHHGNGTEDIFRNEARVLLCSSFQYPLYPNSQIVRDNPHILHLPLAYGSTGLEFREGIQNTWLTKLKTFSPDLIFFSAGFDAHRADPLAGLNLTEEDYFWVSREIFHIAKKSAEGRIVSCLEGGYAIPAVCSSVLAHLRAFVDG